MRRFLTGYAIWLAGALLLVVVLTGCASSHPGAPLYWGGSTADLATTLDGMQNGCSEVGLVFGSFDGEAEIVAGHVALNWLAWSLFKDHPVALRVFGSMRLGQAASNLGCGSTQ